MKIIKIFTLCIWALILTVAATPADADKLHLVINGKSLHVDSDYNWNENNRRQCSAKPGHFKTHPRTSFVTNKNSDWKGFVCVYGQHLALADDIIE